MDNNISKRPKVSVSCVEQLILNYGALPTALNHWRCYRCEYGGHAQPCILEQTIYLPPVANADLFDLLFDFWQTRNPKTKQKILLEIMENLERGI